MSWVLSEVLELQFVIASVFDLIPILIKVARNVSLNKSLNLDPLKQN